jgi:hypothetical protein
MVAGKPQRGKLQRACFDNSSEPYRHDHFRSMTGRTDITHPEQLAPIWSIHTHNHQYPIRKQRGLAYTNTHRLVHSDAFILVNPLARTYFDRETCL